MNEYRQTTTSGDAATTPVVGGSPPRAPGAERSASRDGETRTDSVARLLETVSEYERTFSLLLAAVLRLCLPGRDQGMDDADGPGANRTASGNRPNG